MSRLQARAKVVACWWALLLGASAPGCAGEKGVPVADPLTVSESICSDFGACETACAEKQAFACDRWVDFLLVGHAGPTRGPVLEKYALACERGGAFGCYLAGNVLSEGSGVPQDKARGTRLYQRAMAGFIPECTAGHAESCFGIGVLYQYGSGTDRDLKRAGEILEKACGTGSARGCIARAMLSVEVGADPAAWYPQGVEQIERECQAGRSSSCLIMGDLSSQSLFGVPQDSAKARASYKRGCELGSQSSCAGQATIDAVGAPRVAAAPAEAIDMFRRLCERGNESGCGGLAEMYMQGIAVDKNLARAREYFEVACQAEADHYCFLNARTFYTTDSARAAEFLELACRMENGDGCADLAALYDKGDGVPRDVPRALELIETACDLGLPRACNSWGKKSQVGQSGRAGS